MASERPDDRHWAEVWKLYSHLRDSSEHARSAALLAAPDAVREEVLALLEQSHAVTQPEPTAPGTNHLAPGTAIGRYVITGLIAEGGHGRVYSAHDNDLRRNIAIKVLSARAVGQDLVAEARSASALNHPNILTIHDTIEVNGHQAMVMEFVEGRSLRLELVEANGPLNLKTAADYAIQLAQALAAAHAAGIAHRDVKPENILVRPDGYLKLVDFGLAAAHVDLDESRWQPFAGTLRYTSPEQLRGAGVSAASDIFCFGLVLYEMMAGVHPFRRKTPAATADAIATSAPEPPSAHNPQLPKAVDRLILAMLSNDSAVRPPAPQVADLLSGLLGSRSRTPSARALTYSLIALLIITAVLVKLTTRTPAASGGLRLKTTPLTGNQGRERRPAISSDGKFVVFEWQETPNAPERSLVREIGSERTFELPVKGPLAWVPGTHRIAYTTRNPGEATLRTVSIDGQDDRPVFTATDIRSWAFSPDGRYVAYTAPAKSGSAALFRHTIGTSAHKQLTDPPPPGDLRVAISHDGTQIAVRRGFGDVLISSFPEPGTWRQVVANQADGEAIAWLRGGSGLITSGFMGSNNSLWLHPIAALSTPIRLTSVGVEAFQVNSAADINRLVWLQAVDDTNIWRMPATGGHAIRVVASLFRDSDINASSTGVLAFRSDRSGYPEIWLGGSSGENQKRVTSLEGFTGSPRWSPDGRRLAFDSRRPTGQGDIWLLDCPSEITCQSPVRVTDHPAADVNPNWSRDGRSIYFASRRSGSWQLWRTAAAASPTTPPVQLTTQGGYVAAESSDGKWLYYSRLEPPEVAGLWRRPLNASIPFDTPGEFVLPLARSSTATWSLCGEEVFFQTFFDRSLGPQSETAIAAFHLTTRRMRKIRPDGATQISRGLAVGPGCKSIYFSRLDRSESNVVWADYEITR